jgi:hypothetical protein
MCELTFGSLASQQGNDDDANKGDEKKSCE